MGGIFFFWKNFPLQIWKIFIQTVWHSLAQTFENIWIDFWKPYAISIPMRGGGSGAKFWEKCVWKFSVSKNFSSRCFKPHFARFFFKKLDAPYTTPTYRPLAISFEQILRHPLICKGRLCVCLCVRWGGCLLPHFARFFKSLTLYNTILAYHNTTPQHGLCCSWMLIFKCYHLA